MVGMTRATRTRYAIGVWKLGLARQIFSDCYSACCLARQIFLTDGALKVRKKKNGTAMHDLCRTMIVVKLDQV